MNKDLVPIVEDLRWASPPENPIWQFTIPALWCFTLLALGAFFYLLYRWKMLPFMNPPPPHKTALKRLRASQKYLTDQSCDLFAIQVSEIIRVYVQERFGVRAPHRSTEEFLEELQNDQTFLAQHREALGEFLSQCDLVKFAQRKVAVDRMRELFRAAERFLGQAENGRAKTLRA